MRIEQLRSFIAVYETSSFTQAASQLYTSQPVVTRHVAQLEDELGGPLFTRTTRAVSPTKAGTLLYEKVHQALLLLDEGAAECRALNKEKARLTIGYEYFYMDQITTPWLSEYKANIGENVIADIVEQPASQLFAALSEGRLDCVFIGQTKEELIPAYLEKRRIASMGEAIYVGREHRLAQREYVTVDDLLNEDFIYPLAKPTSRESIVALDFEEKGKKPRATVTVHQPSALKVVESGDSIIDLPTECGIDNPELVRIPYASENEICYFVWNRANDNKAFAQFRTYIESKIDEMSA